MKGEGDSERKAVAKYHTPQLLIIDEFNVKANSDFERRMLDTIIDHRYGPHYDTIIIGNYKTKADFEKELRDTIVSRTHEGGGVMECNWRSFRKQANND